MKLGIFSGPTGNLLAPDEVIEEVRTAHDQGCGACWIPQMPFGPDALTSLALAGAAVPEIELGTAVVPS